MTPMILMPGFLKPTVGRYWQFMLRILVSLVLLVGVIQRWSMAQGPPLEAARATTKVGSAQPILPSTMEITSPRDGGTYMTNTPLNFCAVSSGGSFTWDFGDGSTAFGGDGGCVTHSYLFPGNYSVVAQSESSYAWISITVIPYDPNLPNILTQPANQIVRIGDQVDFTVFATGPGPLQYQWRRDGVNITGATAPIYRISSVTGADFGVRFSVLVSNSFGSIPSAYAVLTESQVAPPLPKLSLTPRTKTLPGEQILSITATLKGVSGTLANWSCTGGTLSATSTNSNPATLTWTAPSTPGTYTVTAISAVEPLAWDTATYTVTVPLPKINAFTVTPTTPINPGDPATLAWDVTGATALSLSGIGAVTGTSYIVTPAATTSYVLTASNASGGVQKSVQVNVKAALTWKGDRIYGFGQLISEDQAKLTGGVRTVYIQSDQVNSANIITDTAGVVQTRMKNLPYGERFVQTGVTPSFERFAGHEDAPDDRNTYMQARTYLSFYGRFAQPDPVYDSSNLYLYGSQNPISHFDPTGLSDVIGIPTNIGDPYDSSKYWVFKTDEGVFYLVPINTQVGDMIYLDLDDKQSFIGLVRGSEGITTADITDALPREDITIPSANKVTYTFDDFLQDAANVSAGFGDTISWGATRKIRQWMDTDGVVDRNSAGYVAGEAAGIVHSMLLGGSGGLKAAGVAGKGIEFSHWVPRRILKQTVFNNLAKSKTVFNGNFVTKEFHALTDPFRYQFMSKVWKSNLGNQIYHPALRQIGRVPFVYYGLSTGTAWGIGGFEFNGNRED